MVSSSHSQVIEMFCVSPFFTIFLWLAKNQPLFVYRQGLTVSSSKRFPTIFSQWLESVPHFQGMICFSCEFGQSNSHCFHIKGDGHQLHFPRDPTTERSEDDEHGGVQSPKRNASRAGISRALYTY